MTPDPLLLAHLLTLVAALDALAAIVFFARWSSLKRHGRGTPRYATARDSRRSALLTGGSALILLAIAWATPLGDIPLS